MNKDAAIREIEVALIRAVARGGLGMVVEAENLAPGGGTVWLWLADGTKIQIEIIVPDKQ